MSILDIIVLVLEIVATVLFVFIGIQSIMGKGKQLDNARHQIRNKDKFQKYARNYGLMYIAIAVGFVLNALGRYMIHNNAIAMTGAIVVVVAFVLLIFYSRTVTGKFLG